MRCLPLVLLVLLAACSEGSVGDACESEGKIDGECEDEAICGKNKTGALICLKQCNDQSQCASNEDCNGVAGTNIKGCRPR
jgi:hypothetical protein